MQIVSIARNISQGALACILGAVTLWGQHSCPRLSSTEIQRLEAFVRKSDPNVTTLEVPDETTSVGPCYRTLRIHSLNNKEETYLLSPDLRFLSRQVIDTRPDLANAEIGREAIVKQMILNEGKRPNFGPDNAPIVINIFSDLECPFCKAAFNTLSNEILPAHPAEVRVIFHHLPLGVHPWAQRAAILTECIAEQHNRLFWKVHNYLFSNQATITAGNLESRVSDVLVGEDNFNQGAYEACIQRAPNAFFGLSADRELAAELEIESTPTLFVNGIRIDGAPPAEQVETIIQELKSSSNKIKDLAERAASTASAK